MFQKEFVCRFCYQLPSDEYCCEPSTSCSVSVRACIKKLSSSILSRHLFVVILHFPYATLSLCVCLQVRGTPSSLYTSNCTALDSVFCLGEFRSVIACSRFIHHSPYTLSLRTETVSKAVALQSLHWQALDHSLPAQVCSTLLVQWSFSAIVRPENIAPL